MVFFQKIRPCKLYQNVAMTSAPENKNLEYPLCMYMYTHNADHLQQKCYLYQFQHVATQFQHMVTPHWPSFFVYSNCKQYDDQYKHAEKTNS